MEIRISDDVKIINDGVYLCVQTRTIVGDNKKSHLLKNLKYENVGKERWESLTYHSSLEMALKSAVEKGITFCDGIPEVIEFYEKVNTTISNLKAK